MSAKSCLWLYLGWAVRALVGSHLVLLPIWKLDKKEFIEVQEEPSTLHTGRLELKRLLVYTDVLSRGPYRSVGYRCKITVNLVVAMVVIQVKRSDKDIFLVESSVHECNDVLVRRLVKIWNTRLRLMQLVEAAKDLFEHGPAKPPAEHGLDEVKEEYEGLKLDKGPYYKPDPTGKRNGNGAGPQLNETLERVCKDAEALLGREQAQRRVAVTQEALDEKMDNIRGAVTMAFPMGLPEYDPVRLVIEGTDGLDGTQAGTELLDENTAGLWMAGKEFRRDQTVGDRVGKNEKTRVTCKLQNPGSGPPGREPAVSEEERKAMMAYYFKRQEELKRLSEANDDEYLASAWADPKQLQRSLRGTTNVRAPGMLP